MYSLKSNYAYDLVRLILGAKGEGIVVCELYLSFNNIKTLK